jgi:hypothetical protein
MNNISLLNILKILPPLPEVGFILVKNLKIFENDFFGRINFKLHNSIV